MFPFLILEKYNYIPGIANIILRTTQRNPNCFPVNPKNVCSTHHTLLPWDDLSMGSLLITCLNMADILHVDSARNVMRLEGGMLKRIAE